MNKKLKRAALMKRHETMFQCPICAANMAVTDLKSLICANGHTFDIQERDMSMSRRMLLLLNMIKNYLKREEC
ncbi:hypothetical protein JEM70_22900 [Bacillaceae bacterium HSR45]|nr:hypothetical protein [Bacillaceae bacterium HSR45]